jgi:hypothetical protein
MPRGRPKKTVPPKVEDEKQLQEFALQFARALTSSSQNSMFFNPIWQNSILKDINMTPAMYDREKIEDLLKNPKNNEDALKDLGQHLMNVIMQFNRLVYYYSRILTFDYVLIPSNADEDDFKKSAYKKSRKKASELVEKINPKVLFPDIMNGVILEDAKFYYVRETEDSITLQEMPSKYCKIVNKTEYGYQYAFNMYYFLRAGVNINDFDSDFVGYFKDFLDNKKNTDQYFYWQKLDPIKAPVFKFDETRAGLTPPLMGLYIDSAEIAAYKRLMKTKTQLDVWKILINKIPIHTDSKGAQTKNNFAIDPDTAAKFTTMIQSAVPDGVKSITTPLDVESFEFNQSQNRDNIVGYGQDNFYNAAGSSPVLFGEKNLNGTGLEASKKVDESYVIHMYRQFERFLNSWLKVNSTRYRFKVIFPDITIFNRSEKLEIFLKTAQFGYSKSLVSCALGINPDDMLALLAYEKSIDLVSNYLIPLQSSHVQNGENGRPELPQSKLKDNSVKSRDLELNENR